MNPKARKAQAAQRRRQRPLWPLLALIGGGALLLVGSLAAFGRPSLLNPAVEVTGTPSLKVDVELIDFGPVAYNQYVEATFQLTNVGNKTLRFTRQPWIEAKEGC
jgi:hypothetical protein